MNQFEMVAYDRGHRDDRHRLEGQIRLPPSATGSGDQSAEEQAETCAFARKSSSSRSGIQVLERITVEKENTLSRQIEELRDR